MLSHLGSAASDQFRDLVASLSLRPREFSLLWLVARSNLSSQQAVGEAAQIPPSTMVALVDGLEQRGLVVRRPHPDDRRSWALALTDSGRTLVRRAGELAWEHERRICQGLGDAQRVELLEMLSTVAQNLGFPPTSEQ